MKYGWGVTARAPCLCLALILVGCSEPEPSVDAGPATDAGPAGPDLPDTLGPAERPARLEPPVGLDGVTPVPALFVLHGFGADGNAQTIYFGAEREARRRGWLLVIPDGTTNTSGMRFWNATPACCDFEGSGVDDVAYLTGLLDELEGLHPVSDVYFLGHSNGGFMSYRMACEIAPRVTAIASLAGSDYLEATDCEPSAAVSVLQIHGDEDDTILYDGSPGAYPPAADVVARWAERAGCDLARPTDGSPLDLELTIDGPESTVVSYETGCGGAEAALWTIVGGGHIPGITRGFTPAVLDWLEARSR